MTRIGWIGLGRMGTPMAKHLRSRDHAVLGYARSGASRARASDAGIELAQSIAAVAAETDVVFSIVSDDAALRDIVLGADGLAGALGPGKVLVEMSTVSPKMSAEVARTLGHRDVAYVRAPVSGSTATAEAGALTVIASGPEHAFPRRRSRFSKRSPAGSSMSGPARKRATSSSCSTPCSAALRRCSPKR
jgi:3-hydroxyisobutyrate dehydrogenase-like beta-hydroxyacid dehydrogenase